MFYKTSVKKTDKIVLSNSWTFRLQTFTVKEDWMKIFYVEISGTSEKRFFKNHKII